jgi:hypothetical protein
MRLEKGNMRLKEGLINLGKWAFDPKKSLIWMDGNGNFVR